MPLSRVLATAFSVVTVFNAAAAQESRTISPSRQFLIYGGDVEVRGTVSQLAERLKARLLSALQIGDRWSVPILLNLHAKTANEPERPPADLQFSQTDAGLRIQLDLVIDPEISPISYEREILRALLLEMSYRRFGELPAGIPYVLPPDWLADGILNFNNESPEVLDAFESIAAHPPSLSSVVGQRAALLDSQSRVLYAAAADVLVRLLLQDENARRELLRYITDLPGFSGDSGAALFRYFPAFGSTPGEWERRWTAAAMTVANQQRSVLLSFQATSEQLDECLRLKIARTRNGRLLTLEEATSEKRPQIEPAAQQLSERLLLLVSHAHPLLRPVIAEYQKLAHGLISKHWSTRTKHAATAAASARTGITARMNQADDFMNWFEATQLKSFSGEFGQYIRAAETEMASRRHDPISVYLDVLEEQFE